MKILRKSKRQADRFQQQPQTRQQPQATQISDSQKLDALATLLSSTRAAISDLQSQLQTNVTRLMQQTGYVCDWRISNIT